MRIWVHCSDLRLLFANEIASIALLLPLFGDTTD